MKLFISLLFLGLVVEAEAGSCTDCENSYISSKTCDTLNTYLDCLETATGDGCPLPTAKAGQITQDVTDNSCTFDPLCVCQKNYWSTDISSGDPAVCTAAKARVTCLRGKTGTACDGASAINDLGTTTDTILTDASCSPDAACTCEKNYVKADVSDDTKMCTQSLAFIGCLKGIDGNLCDGTASVVDGVTAADNVQKALSSPACSPSDGCNCEITYAKADVSNNGNKCTEAKKFISCLKTEEGMGCDGSTTVADLTTAANTYIGTLSGCTKSEACECEVAYASADISDDTKKCTEVKKYISCLKSKTGMGCDGTTTVVQLATAAGTTASGITGCTLTGTTCQCELDYAKADISDNTKLCTETKTYVNCLKGKATTGCVDSKSTLVTAAETTMSGITGGTCDITSSVCACDAAYAKLDTSTDALKCTAEKNYISCLLGKTGTGCDGSTTLIASATAAESSITNIGATCTKTSVCDCEIAYAKADISTNALKCAATKDLTTCTMLSINNGCGASTTKTNVGSVASTAFTALSTNCATTTTCDCQATFNAADVSNSAKCTSANALITCLDAITSTTETACDGAQLTTELKTNVTTSVQAVLCSFGARIEASSFVAVLMMTMSVLVISL